MFASFVNPAGRIWLLALLILWALLLFGGFLFGRPDAPRDRRMPVWTRMASSLALVGAAWSFYAFTRGHPAGIVALLIALGMTLGFVGDLSLAGLLPMRERVLGGMGAFGLGHVAYIVALVWCGNHAGLAAAGPRWGAWLGWLLIGLAGWYLVVYRPARSAPQGAGALHLVALPYALLLASTAGFATGLALQNALFAPLALGAALFLLSDLILAANLFNATHFDLIHDVIWLTYGPGQMLIVFAAGNALRLL